MTEEKHARYLVEPETGRTELVVADEVADKQKAGWKDPEGVRGNGEPYNKPEDQMQTDAAGAALEAKRAAESKAAKEKEEREPQPEPEKPKVDEAKSAPDKEKESFVERTEDFIKSL